MIAPLAFSSGTERKTARSISISSASDLTREQRLISKRDTYAHVTTAAQKEAANTMGNVLIGAAQN